MIDFELHITGDEGIHTAAKHYGLKTIAVDLLRPDKTLLRTEHMTSAIIENPDIKSAVRTAKWYADNLYATMGVRVSRVKLETAPYACLEDGIYVERHVYSYAMKWPTSRNQKRKKALMTTIREYDKTKFRSFIEKATLLYGSDITEVCVYDSYIDEDKDWFLLYGSNRC